MKSILQRVTVRFGSAGEVRVTEVNNATTHVLPPVFGHHYPLVVRGDGCWVEDDSGRRYLDAMSGGSMAATLGHGRKDIIEVARRQARQLSYVHNERLTNPMQERLADELASVAPSGFTRVKFVTGGSEANETALRVARAYHVERGDVDRWQVVSPAQAYHGPTLETLALTGRPGLHGPLVPYLAQHCTSLPVLANSTQPERQPWRLWTRFSSGPAPAASLLSSAKPSQPQPCPRIPPRRFWEGLEERRREHGFLVCFDEVVTGMGRTGTWFAANVTPLVPDVIATAKGLGAGTRRSVPCSCETRYTKRSLKGRDDLRSVTLGTARRYLAQWG